MAVCLAGLAAPAVGDELNHSYPTGLVPLKPGLLLCDSIEQVRQGFVNWRIAFEQHLPEQLADGCVRIAGGYVGVVEYVGPFQNEHWVADIVRFTVFSQASQGLLLLEGVFHGYGSAVIKHGVLQALPRPTYN